jgi:hypothetical protein
MTEPTTPETPDLAVHASLFLSVNDKGGIDIAAVFNPEMPDSRAVHLAQWIGANLEALIGLADKDRAHQQEHAKNQRLITGIGRKLLVPDGAGEIVVPDTPGASH